MNRHEQRDIEWSKRNHNRIYKDAVTCWKETGSVEDVASLLIARGFGSKETQGYLIQYRSLSIDEANEVVSKMQRLIESTYENNNV